VERWSNVYEEVAEELRGAASAGKWQRSGAGVLEDRRRGWEARWKGRRCGGGNEEPLLAMDATVERGVEGCGVVLVEALFCLSILLVRKRIWRCGNLV
jgi:hypothetical protein